MDALERDRSRHGALILQCQLCQIHEIPTSPISLSMQRHVVRRAMRMRNSVSKKGISSESRLIQVADHLGNAVHLNGYSSCEGRVRGTAEEYVQKT